VRLAADVLDTELDDDPLRSADGDADSVASDADGETVTSAESEGVAEFDGSGVVESAADGDADAEAERDAMLRVALVDAVDDPDRRDVLESVGNEKSAVGLVVDTALLLRPLGLANAEREKLGEDDDVLDACGEREPLGEKVAERDASADADKAAERDAVSDLAPDAETLTLVVSVGDEAAERVESGLTVPLTVCVVLMVDDAVPEMVAAAGLRLGLADKLI